METRKAEALSLEGPTGARVADAPIPRPSGNPQDPLNWSQTKKTLTLAILCLTGFSGLASATANQLAYLSQAKLYHKTPLQLSYATSAGFAGLAIGPLVFVPISYIIGRSACVLWSMIGTLVCAVWSAVMVNEEDYIAFIMSRLLGGIFGAVPSTIGASNIVDIYYVHERGRAFTYFLLTSLLGTVAGPTFSGFIISGTSWPVEFWWIVGLEGALTIVVLLFLEETGFTRNSSDVAKWPVRPQSFLRNRIATFLPGTQVVKPLSVAESCRLALVPVIIAFCPVALIAGCFILVNFGWAVMISVLLTVFLQQPLSEGGYGFSTTQNAAFLFSIWVGLFAAQIYGAFLNDRLPLWLSRRTGGKWHPEYRLSSLCFPGFIVLPIGLGIFGATLENYYYYMVLALATFLVAFAAFICVPIATNYIVECFPFHAFEASITMGFYRLVFGLAVPFFVNPWSDRVGVGWVFGMAAFFSLFMALMVVLLMWKGQVIRGWSLLLPNENTESDVDVQVDVENYHET